MAKLRFSLRYRVGHWSTTIDVQLFILIVAATSGVLTTGQESRYFIDPRPPLSVHQPNMGTFGSNGGPFRYSYGNGVVQPAFLKPMNTPPISSPSSSSIVKVETFPAQSLPPVLLPLTPQLPPPLNGSPPPVPSSVALSAPPPPVAPVNSRRHSVCYECPGPYACKTDFLWAACDADCIKIDGTILTERYLPERARSAAAVQGEFRGCFSDRKWSEYLNVVQPNTCAYFEYSKDFPYVHGTVCRCGLDFCNSAPGVRSASSARTIMIFSAAICVFVSWLKFGRVIFK